MPAGASVGEQVVENVLDALRAIDGPPANEHDISDAVHHNGNVLALNTYPAVVVFDAGTEEIAGPNPLVQVRHNLVIQCIVQANDVGWQSSVKRLMTDVTAALRADWTRGGLALDTHITQQQVFDSSENAAGTPFGTGGLQVSIIYRHLHTDPTLAF